MPQRGGPPATLPADFFSRPAGPRGGGAPASPDVLPADFFAREQAGAESPSAAGFIKNVGRSAVAFGGDVATAARHPFQTVRAVAELAAGGMQKLSPIGDTHLEPKWDAFATSMIDRYGGIDNLAATLYNDPVGVLADVASIGGGGGVLAKGAQVGLQAAKLPRAAAVAGKVSKAGLAVERAVDPLRLAARPVTAAGKFGLKRFAKLDVSQPKEIYAEALKPSNTPKGRAQRETILETGLRERIPVSQAGLAKLQGLVEDLNTKIEDTIAAGTAKGVTVDPGKVAARVDDTRKTFVEQVAPESDLAAIAATKEEFLRRQSNTVRVQTGTQQVPAGILDASGNPVMKTVPVTKDVQVPRPIPAAEAQALKTGTYRQLKKKSYGELKGAQVEAEKALARGLKEELAAQFPELAELNARESKLLQLEPELERAIARAGNRETFGIGPFLTSTGVGQATGSTKLAALSGIAHAILHQPAVKSRLAIAIDWVHHNKPGFTGLRSGPAVIKSRVEEYLERLRQAQESREDESEATPAAASR